jgi:hypothetical protein
VPRRPRLLQQYRLRRGPVLVLLLLVGVAGALLISRSQVRPQVDVFGPVTVPAAYDGTTYAFDGVLCVRASSVGTQVTATGAGSATRVGLRPDGAPPAVAYPVDARAVQPLAGTTVAAGDQVCTRLLVTPHGQGDRAAEPVTLSFRYGPFGLLRSSTTVTPPVVLQVTGTGVDPRATA